jgi:hypothetical protein
VIGILQAGQILGAGFLVARLPVADDTTEQPRRGRRLY